MIVSEMEFCQHHGSSHFCVFNNHHCHPGSDSELADSDQSPPHHHRPLARVLERVETFNLLAGRGDWRAAPCPVLLSRLVSSHQATSHHRAGLDCRDCADFAASLSQALRCLLQLGHIQLPSQKVRNLTSWSWS